MAEQVGLLGNLIEAYDAYQGGDVGGMLGALFEGAAGQFGGTVGEGLATVGTNMVDTGGGGGLPQLPAGSSIPGAIPPLPDFGSMPGTLPTPSTGGGGGGLLGREGGLIPGIPDLVDVAQRIWPSLRPAVQATPEQYLAAAALLASGGDQVRDLVRQVAAQVGVLGPGARLGGANCRALVKLMAKRHPAVVQALAHYECGATAPIGLSQQAEAIWTALLLRDSGVSLESCNCQVD